MSRVLSRVIICLGRLSPAASSDQPEAGGPRHRFCSVLLRMGFTEPPLLPGERWSLTPPFHPYRPKPAVSFCCTFLGVASTGNWPAPCPMELGLSSCLRTRSFSFLATFESIAHGGDACQGYDTHLPPRIRPAGHCVMMMRPQFSHSTAALPERTCPSTAAGRDILHPPQRSPCRRVIGGMLCFLMTL